MEVKRGKRGKRKRERERHRETDRKSNPFHGQVHEVGVVFNSRVSFGCLPAQ